MDERRFEFDMDFVIAPTRNEKMIMDTGTIKYIYTWEVSNFSYVKLTRDVGIDNIFTNLEYYKHGERRRGCLKPSLETINDLLLYVYTDDSPLNIKAIINNKPKVSPVKDSGNRREFDTGAVRDMEEGKGRCDLLPACALLRLAKHYENGAKKYEERNWEKGIPISSFIDSGMRHLLKYMDGQTDEDHIVAATWNLMCAMWMEEKRPDLQDIPTRRDENKKNLLNPIVDILGHRQVGDNGEE